MVQVIMGLKGSGKTKKLVEHVKQALEEDRGNVVVLEQDKNLTHQIPYTARLIHATDYGFGNVEFFKGFISGLYAGNYDIIHVFIDNFFRMFHEIDFDTAAEFFLWLEAFSEKEKVSFTISATADVSAVGENIKKYLI